MSIFLGTGGTRPGLVLYRWDCAQEQRLIELTVGESVYALDTSPAGSDIVIGTGSVTIRLLMIIP